MTNKLIGIVMVLCFGALAQVNLTGTVTDAVGGSHLSGVLVALKTLGISDTTDAQGKWQIIATRSTWPGRSSAKGISGSRIVGNLLRLNISEPSPVTVELFNATGVKITTLFKDATLSGGTYDINLSAIGVSAGLYLIRVRQGYQTWVHRYLPMQTALQGNLTNNGIGESRKGMAKRLDAGAAIDTLVFSKTGYGTVIVPIQSYTGTIDTVKMEAILSAPSISSITQGDGSVTVSWNTVSGATSYNLYYSPGTTVDKTSGSKLAGVTSPKQVLGLTNWTQYAFAVSAVNAGGESGLSAVQTGTPQIAAPVISGVVIGDGSATVSWSAVTGATSYNLYYSPGTTVDKTSGSKLAGVTSPRPVTLLTNGTKYAFALSAVNAGGESVLSSVVTATPNIVDIDGNVYHSVTIGTQTWMVENLKTTKYNDGTAIPLVTDATAWAALTTPGYCWYNDTAAYGNTYGALYNWYVVNTGKLAPAGWHVPTDSEWTVLTTYLGGVSGVAGGPLKEAGTTHWASPNTGATNATGFTALPGGYRTNTGAFNAIGDYGTWWSATANDATFSWDCYVYYYSADASRRTNNNQFGFSVRCVRDN